MIDPGSGQEEGGRVLGVVGTLVWDTIRRRDVREEPVEEWGGIGYALEALNASLPGSWEVVPIVKVGEDLAREAFGFLQGLDRVRSEVGVQVVPEPNNRVELHYREGVRISERLRGGVPPWRWPELAPIVSECDALYVNFISGFEMELETARALRDHFSGPLYADLHSLFLGVGREGDRIPRPLPHWAEWLQAFDAVQMNESEFELLARREGDPWALAARVVGPSLKLMTVTMGERGAAWVAAADFQADPFTWEGTRRRMASTTGPATSGRVPPAPAPEEGDPTGCGDVWGATTFARLLAGDPLEEAMETANRCAARNVGFRGAKGLGLHLQGRILWADEDR
jgi:sugar/nucleoside kinase (ribokinase family)